MITYLISDKLSGFFKLGKTKNLKARFSTLCTSNLNLEVILTIEGDHEKFFHKIFEKQNVAKEWFCLTTKDIENIKEYKFFTENEKEH
jgi:fatty acid-binding protein DegV